MQTNCSGSHAAVLVLDACCALVSICTLHAAFIVPVNVGFCTGDNPYGSGGQSGCAQVGSI